MDFKQALVDSKVIDAKGQLLWVKGSIQSSQTQDQLIDPTFMAYYLNSESRFNPFIRFRR
jgi:hypothetical protein